MKKSLLALILTAPLLLAACGAKDAASELTPAVVKEAMKSGALVELKKQGMDTNPLAVAMIDEMMKLVTVESVKDCKEQADKAFVCDVTVKATDPTTNKEVSNSTPLKLAKVDGKWLASDMAQ